MGLPLLSLQAGGNVPKAAKEKLKLTTACNDVHQWFYRSFQHTNDFTANTKIRRVESLFKFCEESLRVQLERKQQEVEVFERRCQHGKTEKVHALLRDDLSPHLFSATHDLFLRSNGTIVMTHISLGTTKYTRVSMFPLFERMVSTSCEALRQKLSQLNTQKDGFEHFNACFIGSFVTNSNITKETWNGLKTILVKHMKSIKKTHTFQMNSYIIICKYRIKMN